MPHSTIIKKPFRLIYDTKVFIPNEVGDFSWRKAYPLQGEEYSQAVKEELDFLDEKRWFSALVDAVIKQATIAKYN